jgi:hypothetical protein
MKMVAGAFANAAALSALMMFCASALLVVDVPAVPTAAGTTITGPRAGTL